MPSILVSSIRESVGRLAAENATWRGCPAKTGWYNLSLGTGAFHPMRCKRHRCGFCGPLNANLVSLALAHANPERAITFTLAGEKWQQRRNRMKRLRHSITREGYATEWAWHVEPNPRGTGHHVHVLQRGDYIPAAHLRSMARTEGFGSRARIEKLRDKHGAAIYNTKMLASAYGVKMLRDQQDVFLDANGGRPVHTSREWWKPNRGLWASVRAAQVQVRGPPDPGPWISFRVTSAKLAEPTQEVVSDALDVTRSAPQH